MFYAAKIEFVYFYEQVCAKREFWKWGGVFTTLSFHGCRAARGLRLKQHQNKIRALL
jgi:hypothetical protein